MSEKVDIYSFHRLGNRKKKSMLRWPSFPKQAGSNLLVKAASPETGFLVVLSFFAGRAVLAGGLVPFPAALLAAGMTALPGQSFWILAAAVGGLFTVSSSHNFSATVMSLVLLFILLGRVRGQFRQKWYGVPILVTGLIIVVKVGLNAFFAPDLYNYLLAIFEAVLAGSATVLLTRALPALRKSGHLASLRKEEIVGGALLVVAFLTGLSELRIAGVELKNVAGRALVLFTAFTGGSGFAAATGTLVGMVPSITAVIAPGMVAVYSFSGLLAGMFRGFGRVGTCIGFILGNVLLSIYLTDYAKLITTFAETALAIGLFMAVPPKRLFAARTLVRNSLFSNNSKSVDEKRIREYTAGKIREYARIFGELSRACQEISCEARVYEENNLQSLFNGISTKVCKGCSLYRVCWEKEFYKTYRSVMDMLSYIELNGRLTPENIPPEIQKRCARLKELAVTVNCLFENYRQARVWQRKITEGRDIVTGQLDGIALIIQNLAHELKSDIRMREDIEAILRSELTKAGYNILDLTVTGEGNDHLEVNITCPSCGGNMKCAEGINPLVSRILSQPLTVLNANYCTKKTGEPVCEFKLLPARAFTVEMGFASAAKNSNLISGDSYSIFDLQDGKFALALSDGMGAGVKAAAESRATITLLEKLLETGFNKQTAVKTVNSILVLGSPDETFTTIDLAVIDLMKGVVDFVKIGSTPSFIKRGDQVSMVRANTLPVGIINSIEVEAIQQPLGCNDLLIMVSDGLLNSVRDDQASESWVLEALQNAITTDPQNIADLLLNKAVLNSGGVVDDDITVIVARLGLANKSDKWEIRSKRRESRNRVPDPGSKKPEIESRKSVAVGRKTADRGQKPEAGSK